MQTWVDIREHRSRRRLFVDGRPFVALGIQIDFLNCLKPEGFTYLFEHIVRMGVNTVFFPVQWFVIEPEQGKFNFEVVDCMLAAAARHDLRISFLWFGTNQGGGFRPAPEWVKNNPAVYTRIRDEQGAEQRKLCPSCPATLSAEKAALDCFLTHLAEQDSGRRGILLQVQNEPCLEMNSAKGKPGTLMDPWGFRCHCDACNAAFAASGDSEWDFSARSLIGYFRGLLADLKRIHPLVTYVNFLINPQRCGEDLDLYLAECPELDVVGCDYYGFGANDLGFTMRFFERGRNVNFIAEHSTESSGEAAANVWRAVCEHGAVAFDPWAIDHTFGWRHWRDRVHERAFVGRDGSWTDAAIDYGRSLRALGAALPQIAGANRTEDMLFYVADHALPRNLEERRWGMVWRMLAGPAGRWAIIRTAPGDFTVVAVQTQAILEPVDAGQSWQVEAGRWNGDVWAKTGEAPVVAQVGAARKLELDEPCCLRIRVE
jgi:hypothetical protein